MSWVATAVIGSAVLGAGTAVYEGNKQSNAQKNAAAQQQKTFGTITQNSQPFMQAGYGATDTLSQLLGTSGTAGSEVAGTGGLKNGYLTSQFAPTQDQLNQYPGYQFALQTGGQAVRNADTPGVGALSGAALKDLTNFNVGTANQYYGQYFNQDQTQKNNIFNRLSSIAGLGQSAAAGVGNSGTQLGIGSAQAGAAAGASQAAGGVGASNALTGGANTFAGLQYLNAQNPGTQLSSGLTYNAGGTGGYTTTVPGSMGPPEPGGGS
jgi:hypothetical protein